ncbi:hypothetical protein BGZ83_009896 [Gryganskiella cystojenkinii]|nr:hypothetical protein BGZ83_009896 [Gryganskiella cystojenkinii]
MNGNDNLERRSPKSNLFDLHSDQIGGGGLRIHLMEDTQDEFENGRSFYNSHDQLARCGSTNSQETIENWRIHVAPSSPPTVPAIEYDLEDHDQLDCVDEDEDCDNDFSLGGDNYVRKGIIPIILSRDLQQSNLVVDTNQSDQLFFDMADLHFPRPLYAFGQTRTQRQGSVNSSIGGYNYSTAASSPSLADSLSNPMYQQQSLGSIAMGNLHNSKNSDTATGSRPPFPPRKTSLPSSICSSLKDDSTTIRGGHYYLGSSPTPVNRGTRTRNPSNLSNVVDFIQDRTLQEQQHEQQRSRSHARSQSQGAGSGSVGPLHQNVSSWEHLEMCQATNAQAGYATMIDLPRTPVSRMAIESQRDESTDSTFKLVSSGPNMRKRPALSLKEALTNDNQHVGHNNNNNNSISSATPKVPDYAYSNKYEGEITDSLVHPLDLTPLLLQPIIGGDAGQRGSFSYWDPSSINPNYETNGIPIASSSWNDGSNKGIGLGLSFGSTPAQADVQSLQRPIAVRPQAPAPQWVEDQYYSQSSFNDLPMTMNNNNANEHDNRVEPTTFNDYDLFMIQQSSVMNTQNNRQRQQQDFLYHDHQHQELSHGNREYQQEQQLETYDHRPSTCPIYNEQQVHHNQQQQDHQFNRADSFLQQQQLQQDHQFYRADSYLQQQQQQQQQQRQQLQAQHTLFPLQHRPQGRSTFQREPSLRNKKNLVLNTAAL